MQNTQNRKLGCPYRNHQQVLLTIDFVESPSSILSIVQAEGLQGISEETAIFHVEDRRIRPGVTIAHVTQPVYRVRDARIWNPTTRYDPLRYICLADAYLAKNTTIVKGFGGNGCEARQVTLRSVIRQ
jgi:hypothetical protein